MSIHDLVTYNFFHHYQPIYDIQEWKIIGFEGLFRTVKNIDPESIFKQARENNNLYELDSRSVVKALQTFMQIGNTSKNDCLFLNVFPSTLINPLFFKLVNKIILNSDVSTQQIIFEINEAEFMDFNNLTEVIKKFKKLRFQIAIDDFGKGFSSMESLIEIDADYVKLDKYFMEGFPVSAKKHAAVEKLLQFCKECGIDLIVEGIEENDSLTLLQTMGIRYAQGYLLGKPSSLPLKR